MSKYPFVVLVILDGLGINYEREGNAVALAHTPVMDMMDANYPQVSLQASGIAVGLPWGEVGNSEVGHQTIGSGTILYQNFPRISLSIEDGSFFGNKAFSIACEHVKKHKSALHLLGLMSDGGVHSHLDHLFALLDLAKRQGVSNVCLHGFTDGRDVANETAPEYCRRIQERMDALGVGRFASLSGRFWAMDRGGNWDRTHKAYDALTNGAETRATSAKEALRDAYARGEKDEKLNPVTIVTESGAPVGLVRDNDACIFFNYREDRARQITKAFALPTFAKFERPKRLENFEFVTFTEYEPNLPVRIAYEPEYVETPFSKVLSNQKMKHLHIAETEKYAHVTYFFNGGKNDPFEGEERIIVPSLPVENYADAPQMSASEVTTRFIERFRGGEFPYAIINYANPDMVGHTGNLEATILAVQYTDAEIQRVLDTVVGMGGAVIVSADHGNCETMIDIQTGKPHTAHTNNVVPLWFVAPDNQRERTEEEIVRARTQPVGLIADISPTVLDLLGIPIPPDMTGTSLLANLQ